MKGKLLIVCLGTILAATATAPAFAQLATPNASGLKTAMSVDVLGNEVELIEGLAGK